ncbi:hypothetical protein [Gemmatimonas phototrophica]|uniref:Uncharacterized protein n=1 Tax=Gemmatimonas phototrophica TaxID=1379270 RepID=A0A143BLY0_9BACT|nr:hypothetical protein [Gemmatimonas phototrophica]AMW05454.1 hypothetical protein GEMMAAP_12850 [Gemmatimonas phototrophica]
MLRNLSRPLFWGIVLAIGVLVAAWRPLEAQGETRSGQVQLQAAVLVPLVLPGEAPATLSSWQHTDHCPAHLSALGARHHRGPSWHRGTGRRSQRGCSDLLLSPSRAGSIPATDPLYLQRTAWHLVPRPPVHGTGQLAAPPRAPPR